MNYNYLAINQKTKEKILYFDNLADFIDFLSENYFEDPNIKFDIYDLKNHVWLKEN